MAFSTPLDKRLSAEISFGLGLEATHLAYVEIAQSNASFVNNSNHVIRFWSIM